jgi:hypothetical protein
MSKKSKKNLMVLLMAFVLTFAMSVPAFAADKVNLSVNGEAANLENLYQDKGISMISLESLDQIVWCDISWTSATGFTVSENGTTLTFVVGSTTAAAANADGKVSTIKLPQAPLKSGEITNVPLRAVCTALGFKVDWNAGSGKVTLDRNEVHDGMTVSEVLSKSTQATAKMNTYSMKGTMDMKMDVVADGQSMKDVPQNMTIGIEG